MSWLGDLAQNQCGLAQQAAQNLFANGLHNAQAANHHYGLANFPARYLPPQEPTPMPQDEAILQHLRCVLRKAREEERTEQSNADAASNRAASHRAHADLVEAEIARLKGA